MRYLFFKKKKEDNLVNKNIQNYIEKVLKKGISMKEIEGVLKKAGWKNDVIKANLALYKAKKDEKKEPEQETKSFVPKHTKSAILRLEKVSKSFGSSKILRSISLEISEGDIFGIIGLSGSGKTTLLNTIIGFLQPDQGDIKFKHKKEFKSVFEDQNEVRKVFGFASQDPSFYGKLTLAENLDLFGSLYRVPEKIIKQNTESLLNLVGLRSAKDNVSQNISGGMQRRLGIACSLIHNPKVLILDEPTSDLDPFLRKEMWDLIRKINKTGTTVIVASHFLNELQGVCSKIAILHDRTILEAGTTDQILDHYSRNREVHLETRPGNYNKVISALNKKQLKIRNVRKYGRKMIVSTAEPEKTLFKLVRVVGRQKERIIDIELRRPSLAEIFETLIKK